MAEPSQLSHRWSLRLTSALAMLVQVGGKTVRDTLFWLAFDQSARPKLVILAALASFPAVALCVAAFSRRGTTRVLPVLFALSGVLLLGETAAHLAGLHRIAACAVWLHLGALGPVLISGWWGAAMRRFDSWSARREVGALAASSSVGALIGGLVCTFVPLTVLLAIFSAAHVWCAFVLQRFAADEPVPQTQDNTPLPNRRVPDLLTVMRTPFLRRLAVLVLITSTAAALVEHVFQMTMNDQFGPHVEGGSVGRLKEMLSAVGLLITAVTLILQVTLGKAALAAWGVVRTVVVLPLIVAGFAALSLFVAVAGPGLVGLLVPIALSRIMENSARTSFFRPAMELFFGAISSDEERAAKTVVDTSVERGGDLVGGLLMMVGGAFFASQQLGFEIALLSFVLVVCVVAWRIGAGLKGGYSSELEATLRQDADTVSAVARTGQIAIRGNSVVHLMERPDGLRTPASVAPAPPDVRISWLRSGETELMRRALAAGTVPQLWVPGLIPLLAREDLKNDLIRVLRGTLPESATALGQALLDPAQNALVRRRIPPILSNVATPAAVEALLRGIEDPAFEIRERCARALVRMRRKTGALSMDRERVFAVIQREIAVEQDVWHARNLLDADDMGIDMHELVEERSDRSLRHVFTLLDLLYPDAPTDIVLKGLRSNGRMRGTALEFLETILPEETRRRLKALLDVHDPSARVVRPAEEIVSDLLKEHQSMVIELARKRAT